MLAVMFGLIALLTAGCVTFHDPESSQEYTSVYISHPQPGETFGQTFISRRPRLNGIDLWLRPGDNSQGKNGVLNILLFHDITDTTPLASLSFPLASFANNNPLNIRFQPQPDPAGQSYYLELVPVGVDVYVQGRNEDVYPGGNAWDNTQPSSADAAFRLSYDYDFRALGDDLNNSLPFLWLILPVLGILLLPGWLILNLKREYSQIDLANKIPLAMGISMALIPVVMTWTGFFGIKWNQTSVRVAWFALIIIAVIILISRQFLSYRDNRAALFLKTKNKYTVYTRLIAEILTHKYLLALIFIFFVSLAVRLIMIRDLVTPAWVDSVHHALITRMILEQGSFPSNYAPYLTTTTAQYHAGYHSLVATFIWLTGLDIPQAMLILGQILNAGAVLIAFQLTTTFTRSQRAGIFAALLTGLFSPMPAYYASWGRYTQLAGLLILPSAYELVSSAINPITWRYRSVNGNLLCRLILPALVCSGLFITHYRVVIFLGCLLLVSLSIHFLQAIRFLVSRAEFCQRFVRLVSIIFLSILLTLPWVIPALTTLILPMVAASTSASTRVSEYSWSLLTSAAGKVTLILAASGLLLALLRRKKFAIIFILWVIALIFVANLNVLHLPGAGLINNTSMLISLFLPLSLMGGSFIDQLISFFERLRPSILLKAFARTLFFISIVAGSVFASLRLLPILNSVTIQTRQADLPAMQWISTNIPQNETILINPFSWGYGLYAGSDGGYWITPLTGRKTMPPPILYALGEDARTAKAVVTFSQEALKLKDDLPALRRLLLSQGIHYIYLGAKGGALSPHAFVEYPGFVQIYAHGGVSIFRVLSP